MPVKRRLICTLGESAGVVTEALDKYFFHPKDPRPISECLIVHTNASKVLDSVKTVAAAFEGGTRTATRFEGTRYPCRVPGLQAESVGPLNVEFFDLGFPDLVTKEQHESLIHRLAFLIAEARQARQPVEVSLAGGRKTESACAAIAAQFFGADRVVHVLPTGLTLEELKRDIHFPLEKYDLTQMPLLDLSPLTYRILDAREERVGSPEDARRLIDELTRHIPALAAQQVERVYSPPAPGKPTDFGSIETRSPAYAVQLERAKAAASSDTPVLITGETGVGKEVLAKAIHAASARSAGPFKHFLCGQYAETLFESELFGVERGAHSEAKKTQSGPIEEAGSGTLFIDEIDSLSPKTQARFLRLVQNRVFERVGGRQTLPVKARLIFATNQDLDTLVEKGTFRQDLRNRIRGIQIDIPPLRARKEDIPVLAKSLLDQYCRSKNIKSPALDEETAGILDAPDWPGNVRDLEQALVEWVDVGRSKGFPLSELRQCVGKRNKQSAESPSDEAGRQLEEILRGELDYKAFRNDASAEKICRLIHRARSHYQEHVKGKVDLEAWTLEHFGVKSLDPDKTKFCKGRRPS